MEITIWKRLESATYLVFFYYLITDNVYTFDYRKNVGIQLCQMLITSWISIKDFINTIAKGKMQ